MPNTFEKRLPEIGQVYHRAAELSETSDGTYKFIVSDESVDRTGDVIRAKGWNFKTYKTNPIVLFGHDHSLPIGISTRIWQEGTKTLAEMKIADEGTSSFIDTVRKLLKQKILRTTSVGFKPNTQPNYIQDKSGEITGFEFVGQDLLEISIVAVPANANAIAVAKSMNATNRDMQKIFMPEADASVQKRWAEENERRLTLIRLGVASPK